MRSSISSKKQRASGRSSLSISSSSSRKRLERRNLNKNKGNDGDSFLLRIAVPRCKFLFSSTSHKSLTVIAVMVLSAFVVIVSRLNCFHVHYGLGGSLSNIEPLGSEKRDGYTDFHFTGEGKITYDQEAIDILGKHPEIKLEDLDLGFVFDIDQFGADPLAIGKGGKVEASASSSLPSSRLGKASVGSIGKPINEILFHVTGERIRNALQRREAQMPRPTVQP